MLLKGFMLHILDHTHKKKTKKKKTTNAQPTDTYTETMKQL